MSNEPILSINVNSKGAIIPTTIKEFKTINPEEEERKQFSLYGKVTNVIEENLTVTYTINDLGESIDVKLFQDVDETRYEVKDEIFVIFTLSKEPYQGFYIKKINDEEKKLHLKLHEKALQFYSKEKKNTNDLNIILINLFRNAFNQTLTKDYLYDNLKSKYSIESIKIEILNLQGEGIIYETSNKDEYSLSN